ncbi:unnamed protein product [Lymnaea stagnalis]|uniref:Rho GTPase-activating protein 190 n=1 Tax=Lymnaea stagnalis TaxID=6523 RepID=A0AAV2ISM9_LYMST
MARRAEGRTFNVSVIGLSGTEREKGQYGVGKSCLCNRFLNQVADNYYQEHISVLSQSDFAGRVINNDHFLYWGSVVKTDDGNNFTFHVVEQTEFIDDVSFSPFKTARTETYVKRAVSGKVQSAEKLMYICKDQLGMETDVAYPQVLMPEGKLTIDGFLCCFDVSKVPQRTIEKQVEFVAALLNNALKTKKPVVIATTKGDTSCQEYVKEAEKLINRKEFKGNSKILPFVDARKQRHELLEVAKEAYIHLLRTNVVDPKAVWNTWKKKLEQESDFGHYVEMFGTEQARKEFRAHTKRLRDEQIRLREQRYLSLLPQLLKLFLPTLDSIPERAWNPIRRHIRDHPDFDRHFVIISEEGCSLWKQADMFLDNTEESRIPYDLLNSAEAEMCFRNHLNELQALHKKKELQRQFKRLLEESAQVTPGRPLAETYLFFISKECYTSLDEPERILVYDQHLAELRLAAKSEFYELLWEKSSALLAWNTAEKVTNKDLDSITAILQDDRRYQALERLDQDRRVMVLNHLGFIQSPSRERCCFHDRCIDTQVENLLASRAIRPELKSSLDSIDSGCKTLNLVLLGKDGLAISLNREIRNLCTDDEYTIENTTYSLDYRPIDGDVSREQNALATANFRPHGCLCVYNSDETLSYIRDSLERSLKNDVMREGEATLSGMPIAIIQASNSSQSEKESEILREKGRAIAARLHGEFIVDYDDVEDGVQFVPGQIHAALQAVIRGCSPGLNSWYLSDQFEPDIRLSMCLMCGDPFQLEVPLGPLLNHDMCRVLADTPYCITLDLFLEPTSKQKVEIEVASFHGGNRLHQGLFHGYILVFSARRKASLATLRAFADTLLEVPKLIVAVVDSGASYPEINIQEGSQLADSLGASFMTTTANFSQQTGVFLPFFQNVWQRREESEALYHEPSEEPCPPAYVEKTLYGSRPPAPLPKQYVYHTHKSSTSNSTDSEPVYDQPNLFHSHYSDSDHEPDRGSSVSPPPAPEEIYSEVIIPNMNGEHLVKPSYVKARNNVYAGESNGYFELIGDYQNHGSLLTQDHGSLVAQNHGSLVAQNHGNLLAQNHDNLSQNAVMFRSQPSQVTAPLAIPEPIEIADYSSVKDAVPSQDLGDNDYQIVDDALPPGQLHRIRSTKSPLRVQGHTDSEDSEFSSLERDQLNKSRRANPHRRKSKQRQTIDNSAIYASPTPAAKARPFGLGRKQIWCSFAVPSHSPSEDGSEGTGDEKLSSNKKEKKRRSFNHRKWRNPTSTLTHQGSSPPISDSDHLIGSPPAHSLDDMAFYNPAAQHFQTLPKHVGTNIGGSGGADEAEDELNDSGNWSRFRFTLRDRDKQRKKEERRRQKEEEKKAKEAQKKFKKKEKASGTSTSGVSLEDFPTALENPFIPQFVFKCVSHIEAEGLKTEGLYRIPGNKAQGELFVNKFAVDPNVDISTLEIPVNAIATLLKSFFSDLSEALIPEKLCDELMEAAEMTDKSSRLIMLRGVIKKLPQQNFEVLKYIISHLYKVAQNQEFNSMNSRNLAKCWWPTLIRLQFKSYEKLIQGSQVPEDIVQNLIEQCPFFFHGGNEV